MLLRIETTMNRVGTHLEVYFFFLESLPTVVGSLHEAHVVHFQLVRNQVNED